MEEERPYFAFGATLRVYGAIPDLDGITLGMGLQPTHTHRAGAVRQARTGRIRTRPYKEDAWHYTADPPEEAPLDLHLQTLWMDVAPRKDYLLSLKSSLRIDVFCGYRSNSSIAGFEVQATSLRVFTELDIPFGVSVIITG
ncbi:MAG: DUF4279 domain-containing protein [Bauldia sp.]